MASKLLSSGYVATPRPLKSQGTPTLQRSSTSRWLWTLRRSCGWRASATSRSTPRSGSRRSSSTTSKGRSLAQVLITILLSVNRNVTSSCGPTHVASSTFVWPNRLNYSGSSALVIAIQPILTQRTSNGIIHGSVGSPPDTTMVQQDRSRFTSHEGEFTITAQLINF
jgi:hypothetical protein